MSDEFDPIGAIATADQTLAEFSEFLATEADELTPIDLHSRLAEYGAKLAQANRNLGLQVNYYRIATPTWTRFAFEFAIGFGGAVLSVPTYGLSLIFTAASAGIALNSVREYVDNSAQLDRIELRMKLIEAALHEIERRAA